MEYSEEKARKIIEKFNLDIKTLKVWRSRNAIPNKYFDKNFTSKQVSRADAQGYSRLIEVLSSKNVNVTAIAEIAGVAATKITDIKRGKDALNENEFIALKSTINQLKIDVVKTFQSFSNINLRNLLNRPEFYLRPILHDYSQTEYDRISKYKMKKIEIEKNEWENIKARFLIFAMQLKI